MDLAFDGDAFGLNIELAEVKQKDLDSTWNDLQSQQQGQAKEEVSPLIYRYPAAT